MLDLTSKANWKGVSNMKIVAAVMRSSNARFELESIELDAPRADEVLVRIVGAGVCHTDLVAQEGYFPLPMPAVFGHEGAGIVEQVGSAVTKVRPGDRVALTFNSCGQCSCCLAESSPYCKLFTPLNYSGARMDGSKTLRGKDGAISGSFFGQSSFASYSIASERNVVKVLDGVQLEFASVLGCGVQTGAGAVMRSMVCRPRSSLMVLGGGAVGLSAVLGGVVQGCSTIIVVEPLQGRRELALSLGATHVIDPAACDDLSSAARSICPDGVDYVLDTSGRHSVVSAVPRILAARGTFGFVGVPPANERELSLPGTLLQLMRGGFTYRGIIEGDSEPDVFLPQLMELYLAGRFPFDRMIKTYPLAHINEAIADQHRGLCTKVVLLP
ncbi:MULTISPECIES: NAD(P)-dependent alcohol dehydrogenase [unclassified Pseudomonas]|uniref:NAD(P)-dependent alcohol dehydrogenase n=1 Tax=unclassified Pseudomonas TaxID=196821 RepID=UPI0017A58293|nr:MULTISPECIES: NAD(P)-dependent alcohol dehydrogenase [unclassified Pseudomonas]MBB6290524.1 aryl-alcohol dehydrogenase [Pseudomonas sp. SJZ073]MBB6315749.1 aryl-alcohol dehydrogenase [Pseudomonas sp. JAI120]